MAHVLQHYHLLMVATIERILSYLIFFKLPQVIISANRGHSQLAAQRPQCPSARDSSQQPQLIAALSNTVKGRPNQFIKSSLTGAI